MDTVYRKLFVNSACHNPYCCNPKHLYRSTIRHDPYFSEKTAFEKQILAGSTDNRRVERHSFTESTSKYIRVIGKEPKIYGVPLNARLDF